MAILKYSYLSLGVVLYGIVNYFSYTKPSFEAPIGMKILFSTISFVLLVIDYLVILFTKKFFKKDFSNFTTYVRVTLLIGVIIIPLISLYY